MESANVSVCARPSSPLQCMPTRTQSSIADRTHSIHERIVSWHDLLRKPHERRLVLLIQQSFGHLRFAFQDLRDECKISLQRTMLDVLGGVERSRTPAGSTPLALSCFRRGATGRSTGAALANAASKMMMPRMVTRYFKR